MKVVGVLGGGQLGRMMAIAAHNLGTVKVGRPSVSRFVTIVQPIDIEHSPSLLSLSPLFLFFSSSQANTRHYWEDICIFQTVLRSPFSLQDKSNFSPLAG